MRLIAIEVCSLVTRRACRGNKAVFVPVKEKYKPNGLEIFLPQAKECRFPARFSNRANNTCDAVRRITD